MLRTFFKKYFTHILETWKLSVPIIVGRFGAVMMGVTDNMMVGKVSYTDLAASGVANAIFFLFSIFPLGMLVIGSPMISGAWSRGDKAACVSIMKACVQLAMLVSLAVAGILLVVTYFFEYLGQESAVAALAQSYLWVIIISLFPLMFFIAVEQFTDGLQRTWVAMFFNLTGLAVNFGLNYILIFGYFEFPALGLFGAGIGTLLARTYMAVGIWIVVRRHAFFRAFDTRVQFFKRDATTFWEVWHTGYPSGFQFFFEVSAFALAAVMVGWLGSQPLAAHNLALSVASVTYMISTGIASAGSIRVGQYFGTKDFKNLRRAGVVAFSFVTILMLVFSIGILSLHAWIIPLFTADATVALLSADLLAIAAIWQLSDGVQITALGALRALQDVRIPMYVTLFSYWVLALPFGYLLGFYTSLGVFGVWWGLVLGLTFSALTLTIRFFTLVRNQELSI